MAQPSTFAERFRFSRDRQRLLGTWQKDEVLADAVGVAPGQITAYKDRDEAPPALRTLRIAKVCGVDPGWLAFGEDTSAAAPDGFENWLAAQRKSGPSIAQPAAVEATPSGAKMYYGQPAGTAQQEREQQEREQQAAAKKAASDKRRR